MEQEQLTIRKIRNVFGLVSFTFEFLRQNFSKFSRAIVFYAGPAMLLLGIFMGLFLPGFRFTLLGMGAAMARTGFILALIGSVAITMQTAIVNTFVMLYMDRGGWDGFEVRDVWVEARKDIVMLLLTVWGIGVGSLLLLVLASVTGPFIIIFYFPVLYLTIALSLAPSIRSRERLGFTDSVKRSFELINGKWWSTFGLMIVMGFIVGVIAMILYVPATFISLMLGLHEASSDDPSKFTAALSMLMTIISMVSYLLYSILLLAINFQYYNLVEQKDGLGMMEEIESIGQDHNLQDSPRETM